MTSRRLLLPLLLVLGLSACGPFGGNGDHDAIEAAAKKLAASMVDHQVVAAEVSDPAAVAAASQLLEPLTDIASIQVGDVKQAGNTGTAVLTWKVTVDGHDWAHATKLSLVKRASGWKAVWKPTVVESSLKADETLAVTGLKADRGNIVGAGDKPIVEPRRVVRFGIDKANTPTGSVASSARRLAALVGIEAAPYQKLVAKAGPKAFVQAIVLRRSDVSSGLLAKVAAIRGALAVSDHQPLAPAKDFAAELLGTVGPVTAEIVKKSNGRLRAGDDAGLSGLQLRYDAQLGGTSGVRVSAVPKDPNRLRRTLFEVEAKNGTDLKLTMDVAMQTEAQKLLRRYGPASALVAIRPSTGAILAAASGPGSKGYNTATFGQYAPGSTFKIVSSLALLRAGLKPTTTVPCPASVDVFGKKFKNYSDYPSNRLGRITLKQAVANSCNTAFISERSKVTGTALADAAAALGFGVDHDTGFPAYFGQVPPPSGKTEAAADLIGQGKVLASPMAMATVVASVVKGSTVLPFLIPSVKPEATKPAKPLTSAEAASLRSLMRAVVTEGSGIRLRSLGNNPPVYAKTGTAEFGTKAPLQTHTWMVGARGDLAVAVFVDVGQSGSQTAGPVLEAFLRAVG
ncbi:penicillin-binding transpeptidase domain-containing protein [Nocardioides marmorisolisilvae]|uniref:Beta-lactamase n=1 Tax=Nocardioides marmorisolisilvae TaxID=1542737 RepID=A0A3N0DJ60_9ACTN|nr:penicillin-binding transpeptidase domain-containing protein [Nocardioides marmorisolisilvae]RNL75441.1 penicillin-binding protein [Nocardioides marmorisolisilvae]